MANLYHATVKEPALGSVVAPQRAVDRQPAPEAERLVESYRPKPREQNRLEASVPSQLLAQEGKKQLFMFFVWVLLQWFVKYNKAGMKTSDRP